MNTAKFIREVAHVLQAVRALKLKVRKIPKRAVWTLDGTKGHFTLCYSETLGWTVIPSTSKDFPAEIEQAVQEAVEKANNTPYAVATVTRQKLSKSRKNNAD